MSPEDGSLAVQDLKLELKELKKGQAVQATTAAGAQTTQSVGMPGQATTTAAAQPGMTAAMVAGARGFVAGIFLSLAIAKSGR